MHKTVQEKLAAAALAEAYSGEWDSLSERDQVAHTVKLDRVSEEKGYDV